MRNNMDVLMLKVLNTNPAQSALQEHQLCTWSPFEFARKTTAEHELPTLQHGFYLSSLGKLLSKFAGQRQLSTSCCRMGQRYVLVLALVLALVLSTAAMAATCCYYPPLLLSPYFQALKQTKINQIGAKPPQAFNYCIRQFHFNACLALSASGYESGCLKKCLEPKPLKVEGGESPRNLAKSPQKSLPDIPLYSL